MSALVLLIEDDASLREILHFRLEDAGLRVIAAEDGRAGLAAFSHEVDVVLTDLRMPGLDGMDLLDALRERDPDAAVVVFTAFGSADRAVEAMRRGAYHYVEKPVNMPTLLAVLARAAEQRRLRRENAALERMARRRAADAPLIAASPAMNRVLRLVDKVAPSDATILLLGESGTGKELIARAIHARSPRAGRPFVAVNCGAIPADLLESALFGHERGAFTGAHRATPGKFRLAEGGTLLLDEIAELAPDLQTKLLRVLQEGEIEAVGAARPNPVDVRILAATHRDLEAEVAAGRFRQDLYYRLNVIPIDIPPLRDRPEDIPVLARSFIRRADPTATLHVERAVDERLLVYPWPGNVRELQNVIERMMILRDGDTLRLEDLPPQLAASAPRSARATPGDDALPFALPEDGLDLEALERAIIEAALERHGGNKSAAARYLRIPRHVLLYRLQKYSEEETGA